MGERERYDFDIYIFDKGISLEIFISIGKVFRLFYIILDLV